MKKLTKLAPIAGVAMAMLPMAAKAADDMTSSDYTVTTTADAAATSAAAGGLFAGFFVIWAIMVLAGIALFIFWIFMLIDVFKRTNWKQESDKTLWILLVILLGYLGAIIYYFAVKRPLDAGKKAAK